MRKPRRLGGGPAPGKSGAGRVGAGPRRGYLGGHKYFSWTDLAFAGYHILVLAWFIKVPWLVIAFIVLTVAAYIWRYIASKLEGLAVPLLSHIVADVSIIAVTCVLIR